MRTFDNLENAILLAGVDYPEFTPGKPEAVERCRAMVKEGLLTETRRGTFENTAKGERAYWHSIGKGAAYDRNAA